MKRVLGMPKLKRRLPPPRTTMLATNESGTYPIATRELDERARDEDAGEVTLVVYGWQNVQPGTLSWVFPSFDAAMRAAGARTNATQWAIMGGSDASGRILAERSA
jgi:hypothetical protein